ncbi:MAG: GNAT family N-acetyltransferase [Acidobacteriaceae bacterium]
MLLLRPAEPDDALPVARVHVRAWQAAYRKLLPDKYLDQLRPEDRAGRYDFGSTDIKKPHTVLAAENGIILGFATTSPALELEGLGEICALYVDPGHWGCGIGVALVSAARTRLFDLGFRNAVLWVLAGNVRAERFYQMDQWMPNGLQRTVEMWGVKVDELGYSRRLDS